MAKPFNESLQSFYEEREKYCRSLDEMDRGVGHANPSQCDPFIQLRTGLFALECGLVTKDWDTVGDALVLLHELHDLIAANH
jgi:hypothetical protein